MSDASQTSSAQKPIGRRHRWLAIAGFTLLLVITGGWSWWHVANGPIAFDKAIWDASADARDGSVRRHRMADGLIESQFLLGKSKQEALEMLGESSSASFGERWNLVFVLGPCRHPMGIDTEFLALHIDDTGKVAEAAILED